MLHLTAMQIRTPSLWFLLIGAALIQGCTTTSLPREEVLSRQVMFTVAEKPLEKVQSVSLAAGFAGTTGFDSNEPDLNDEIESRITRIIHFHRLKKISRWSIKTLGLEAIVAEIRGDRTVDQVVRALAEDDRVESVQAVQTYDLLTYNDPYFHLQSASVKGADIERVHTIATGKDVTVGVIDTGVDRQHPELAERIIMAKNFVDHDSNHFDNDEHGTSVAGIIGSTANNDLGIVGVAPEVKLMVFKACWQDTKTHRSRCDSFSIIKALNEVLKQQPDILNLSLAGPSDPLIRRLISAASDRGIIVVAAVDSGKKTSFPASMREVIAVGAPLPAGKAGTSMPAHALLAPGTDILTTTPGSTYAFRSGSSMATAYVSGVAALMKEREPTLSSDQFRAQLMSSSRHSVDMIPVVDICQAVVGPDEDACKLDAIVVAKESVEPTQ